MVSLDRHVRHQEERIRLVFGFTVLSCILAASLPRDLGHELPRCEERQISLRPDGDRAVSRRNTNKRFDMPRPAGLVAIFAFLGVLRSPLSRARSHSVNANTNSVQPPGKASVSGQICGKRPATADPQPTGTAMYCLLLTE